MEADTRSFGAICLWCLNGYRLVIRDLRSESTSRKSISSPPLDAEPAHARH